MNSWNAEWTNDLDAMVDRWNKANPDASVEVIKWTWDTYFATMTAGIGAGEAPDVMNIGWGEVVLIGQPHLVDITPMLSKESRDSFYEASFKSCTFDGKVYGLPVFEQMNQVLYYRTDIAKDAGVNFDGDTLTWQNLGAAAQKLTKGDRFGLGVNAKGRGIVEPFAPYQYQNGSAMVERKEGRWASSFDSEEGRAAGKYFIGLWRDLKVVNPNNLEKGYTELVQDLGLGSIGMFHGVTQNYFAFAEQFPALKSQIKIAPPQTSKQTSTVGGAFSISMFKYSKAQEQAFKFMQYLTSSDAIANVWLPKGNVLSPRKDVPSPGMPDDIAKRMRQYQDVQSVFPFSTQWETVREKVLAPRLAQMAQGQLDFDSGWKDIHEQTQLTVRTS